MSTNQPRVSLCIKKPRSKKKLRLIFFFKKNGTPKPVLLFSPGTHIDPIAYTFLLSEWANAGFFVVGIKHFPRCHKYAPSEDIRRKENWLLRSDDVQFLVQALKKPKSKLGRLQKLANEFDPLRISLAGHSHGAHTALVCAGAKILSSDKEYSPAAFRSIIALSPPGIGAVGFNKKSFKSLKLPLLVIAGSLDVDHTFKKKPSWRKDAFRYARSPQKSFVELEGVTHYDFIDGIKILENRFEPPNGDAVRRIAKHTLAFLKRTHP